MATGTEPQEHTAHGAAAITLTELAAQKVRELLLKEGASPAEAALRLKVAGGGCSGYQYEMSFDTPAPTDHIFESHGVRVAVDPRSLMFLAGSQVDFVETMMGAGFKVENPNVTGSCGCGHSFKV